MSYERDMDKLRAAEAQHDMVITNLRKQLAMVEAESERANKDCVAWADNYSAAQKVIITLRAEHAAAQGELQTIDELLARRDALDAIPNRTDKIQHAINTAKRVDILQHTVDRTPLCPDHRDKVRGRSCLECGHEEVLKEHAAVEAERDRVGDDLQRMREALEQIASGADNHWCRVIAKAALTGHETTQ